MFNKTYVLYIAEYLVEFNKQMCTLDKAVC